MCQCDFYMYFAYEKCVVNVVLYKVGSQLCHSIMIIHTPCVLTRTNSFRLQFTAVCLLFVGSALLTTCTLHIHRNM